jgi:hypothetical protein
MTENFKFLRGARLLQWCDQHDTLEEVTLQDLEHDTVFGFPNTTKRQHATDPIHITKMQLVPAVPTQDLICNGTAQSSGKTYDPKILFLQVEYQDDDTRSNVTFKGSDGKDYNIQPISLARSNVKVTCNCLDFRWRFSVWNDNQDALYGDPPPPYQRKTTTRPPANPNRTPGICKHLIKMTQNLRQAGLVS